MQSSNLRSNLGIQVEILKAIRNEIQAKPSHILQRANLSHANLTRYLDRLVSSELISLNEIGGKRTYALTDNGVTFLKEMVQKEEFLSGFGLSL